MHTPFHTLWISLLWGVLSLGLLPISHGQPVESAAYTATAATLPIGENPEKPTAEIFFIAYTRKDTDPAQRPITFVFNGGPGSASVYLHLGALGPYRLVTPGDGRLPDPPGRLEKNDATWLTFTDLVFIDPVGTGYSRALPPRKPQKESPDATDGDAPAAETTVQQDQDAMKPFWGTESDVRALGQFIRLYLTRYDRWLSPKALAGESYGGLRVAALTKALVANFDIALNGAILISPRLNSLVGLDDDRYTLLPWVTLLPTQAAIAQVQGRAAPATADAPAMDEAAIEIYALTDYLIGLATAPHRTEPERTAFYRQVAGLIGLDTEHVAQLRGRVDHERYAKLLLRDQGRVLDRYLGDRRYRFEVTLAKP